MADDFYTSAAQQRFAQIEADRAQALADLQQAKSGGDGYSAAEAVQRIADLDSAARNLVDLHQRYSQSQNPPPAPEATAEERHARPWDRMDATDMLNLARQSKYAKDMDFSDPNFQAGVREVQRRRARGE
jgi:hypothetical protein